MDAHVLFGPYNDHSERWRRAADIDVLHCPGKDPIDVNCKCPDVMYATKVRIATAETTSSRIYCGCCQRDIHP